MRTLPTRLALTWRALLAVNVSKLAEPERRLSHPLRAQRLLQHLPQRNCLGIQRLQVVKARQSERRRELDYLGSCRHVESWRREVW